MKSLSIRMYPKLTVVFTALLLLGSGGSLAENNKTNNSAKNSNYLPPGKLRSALTESFEVYDATGRLIGTTTDGLFVLAAFPGHRGSKFRLYVGNGDTTPTVGAFNPTLFFLDSDCAGEPYVQRLDFSANHLDGVTQLRQLAAWNDGSFVYGDDTVTPHELFPGSFANYLGVCSNTDDDDQWEGGVTVIGTRQLIVNWVLPLSTNRH